MKYLMVSYNCGASYDVAAESDSFRELELLAVASEREGLRWYIDNDDDDEPVSQRCAVHEHILSTLRGRS